MMRLMTALSVPGLLLAAQPALAAPPAEAKPLSEIEWEDRGGYWEVDYMQTEGGKVEVKLDPVTGQPKH
jgi:hypothetical protein